MKKILLVFVVLMAGLSDTAAYSGMSCSDYPGKDLIVLVDESQNNVSQSEYLTNSDLPGGWMIKNQGELTLEDINEYILKSELTTADYEEDKFLGMYVQTIYAEGEEVDVLIESFTERSNAEKVYEAYVREYKRARNVVDFESPSEYGVEGFTSQIRGQEFVYKFIDRKNRLIHVWGLSEDSVKYVAEKYSNLKGTLIISETRHFKAKVCEPQSPACTQTFYFSPTNDEYKVIKCVTQHAGRDISCPESRMDKYAAYLEVPFPSCEKGDIIEITYIKGSEFPIKNRFWSYQDFYFERTYPAEELRLTLTVPEGMDIKHFSTGDIKPEITEDDGYITFLWEKDDIKPYESENLMPPLREVVGLVSYSSLKSWDEVKDWAEELFNNAIDPEQVKKTVKTIVNADDSEDEKIKKIYEWVRDEIRYEDSEIGFTTGYQPHYCGEVLDFKFGDCKDKTVLIVSMLDAAGVKAYPVLVSRDAINMETPSPNEFYHAIAVIPREDGDLWLDSTCSNCPYGYIPTSEQDVDVLILSHPDKGFTKTPVNDKDKNRVFNVSYMIDLDQEGGAEIKATLKDTGENAVYLKNELEDADDVEDILGYIVEDVCSDFELLGHKLVDSTDEEIILLEFTAKCDHFATKSEDKLVYTMVRNSLYSETIDDDERRFPIVIDGRSHYTSSQRIRIPADYIVELTPNNYSMEDSFAGYNFGCTKSGSEVVCSEDWVENEITLLPSEFESFKDFYKGINSLKKSIVLSPERLEAVVVNKSTRTTVVEFPATEKTLKDASDEAVEGASGGIVDISVVVISIFVLIIVVMVALLLRKKKPESRQESRKPKLG